MPMRVPMPRLGQDQLGVRTPAQTHMHWAQQMTDKGPGVSGAGFEGSPVSESYQDR